jgi:hypothetical protein
MSCCCYSMRNSPWPLQIENTGLMGNIESKMGSK